MTNKTKYPKRITKRRVAAVKVVAGVKANGVLKKGYRYLKGGRVAKVVAKKTKKR